jgi:hypothetical protein
MPFNPPARIPTPDPQCSCDLHAPRSLPLPPAPDWQPPPEIPTMRYRRLPEILPISDEEPTEPGTPPPPLAASGAEATPRWEPCACGQAGEWLL